MGRAVRDMDDNCRRGHSSALSLNHPRFPDGTPKVQPSRPRITVTSEDDQEQQRQRQTGRQQHQRRHAPAAARHGLGKIPPRDALGPRESFAVPDIRLFGQLLDQPLPR